MAGKTKECPDCFGRGVRAVGTEEVRCDACNGTGKVKA